MSTWKLSVASTALQISHLDGCLKRLDFSALLTAFQKFLPGKWANVRVFVDIWYWKPNHPGIEVKCIQLLGCIAPPSKRSPKRNKDNLPTIFQPSIFRLHLSWTIFHVSNTNLQIETDLTKCARKTEGLCGCEFLQQRNGCFKMSEAPPRKFQSYQFLAYQNLGINDGVVFFKLISIHKPWSPKKYMLGQVFIPSVT